MGNIKEVYGAFCGSEFECATEHGWLGDANYSNNYTIKPGEVSPLGHSFVYEKF